MQSKIKVNVHLLSLSQIEYTLDSIYIKPEQVEKCEKKY